jgi:hypothetical protein
VVHEPFTEVVLHDVARSARISTGVVEWWILPVCNRVATGTDSELRPSCTSITVAAP